MKRLSFALLGLLVACSSASPSSTGGGDPIHGDGEIAGTQDSSSDTPGAMYDSASSAGAPGGGASSTTAAGGGGTGAIQPGILTAGVWDDNKNFDLFLGYKAKVTASGATGLLPLSDDELRAANAKASPGAKQTLDVSIVIDTTGSMGDEIRYLDREFDAIASTIQAKFPGAAQHWSLVAYKDKHDPYVARWFDFRSDLTELHSKLSTLEASGGGDFPESPEVALDVASRLSWRTDAGTARLVFWVADAPHHDADAGAMANSVRALRDKGIHVYPVASSGIDEMTELTMREAAQVTNGRYVFLTDDSGVGGAHKEPSVPCYFVTKLNDAILRMVDIEMSGSYREPSASELVRTGGDPKSGTCTLDSGTFAVY